MHILITGAAGMIGRKLIERLVVDRALNGQPIDKLTVMDIVAPTRIAGFSDREKVRTGDLADPAIAMKAISERPDVIFHLAGVVSGEAEVDLPKGYHVNLDGTRSLLEAVRKTGDGYKPRVIFTSSIAVFGAPFPHAIPDDFHLTPLTSYGAQKAMCEQTAVGLHAEGHSRRRRHPAADHRGAARQAEQGGVGVFLRHHPRAAQWRGGAAAGSRYGDAHPRQPALGDRLSDPRRRAFARQDRAAHQPDHAGRLRHGRRADRGAASGSPATRSRRASRASRTSW